MLIKSAHVVYVPPVLPVQGTPERTVCQPDPTTPAPGGGSGATVCEYANVLLGYYTMDDYQQGRCRYDQIGSPKYALLGPFCHEVT